MTFTLRKLSDEQIAHYRENGFVKVEDALTPDELEELRESMEEVMRADPVNSVQTDRAGGVYYKVLNQRVNTWRDHGGMAKFVLSPRFADMARQLTGFSGIRLFHDHALWKMPQDSKETPWHQDFPYWPMQQDGALSIWIPLEDVDETNGCMAFVPKSHLLKNVRGVPLAEPHDIFSDENVKGKLDRSSAVVVPLKAGSVTFHNGLTFHYAHANRSDQPRRVLAIIYMPDGTTFSGKKHPVTDGLNLQPGDKLAGALFPKLA